MYNYNIISVCKETIQFNLIVSTGNMFRNAMPFLLSLERRAEYYTYHTIIVTKYNKSSIAIAMAPAIPQTQTEYGSSP